MTWKVLIGIGLGVGATWLGLIVYLLSARPSSGARQESLRLLPDTLRLLRRLAADRATPRGVRFRLGLLFVYLALPIDVVPDFIPGIGYADDMIITAATLRSVVRRAGPALVRRHWPGTPDGLAALWRLARLGRRRSLDKCRRRLIVPGAGLEPYPTAERQAQSAPRHPTPRAAGQPAKNPTAPRRRRAGGDPHTHWTTVPGAGLEPARPRRGSGV